MTRKDFEVLAAIVRSHVEAGSMPVPAALDVAYRMADHCATRNPRFDRERFLTACGLSLYTTDVR